MYDRWAPLRSVERGQSRTVRDASHCIGNQFSRASRDTNHNMCKRSSVVATTTARKCSVFVLWILFCLVGAGSINVSAQTGDPHQIYENRCGHCHAAHAGDFVHDVLAPSNGGLKGLESGQDLRDLLDAGHGGLSAEDIEILYAHLIAVQRSGRLFHSRCRICHDRAVVLARERLTVVNGRLIGRYTKRDMEEFLWNHGRLDAGEVTRMIDVLKRQLKSMED